MKLIKEFFYFKGSGLNPLQEVGVMKLDKPEGKYMKNVLIPFRKSG